MKTSGITQTSLATLPLISKAVGSNPVAHWSYSKSNIWASESDFQNQCEDKAQAKLP